VLAQAPDEAIKRREGSQPPVPAAMPTGTHEMTATDIEAFLDGLVPLQLKQADIAGATISVVKDGKLLFAKGYGYADVANKKPVSDCVDLIFVAALFGLTIYGLEHLEVFSDRGSNWFRLIQIVGLVGAIGTLVVLINAALTWFEGRRSIWMKLQATILLLASLGVLWFAFAGNLLRFSSSY
jgi:hypothetical protein